MDMSSEVVVGIVGVIISVVGVGIGWMQYQLARQERQHLQAIAENTEIEAAASQHRAAREDAQTSLQEVVTAAIDLPLLPVPKRTHLAGLEAALAVARELQSPYDRDIKRCQVFQEALRRKEYRFAVQVVEEFENHYDRDRCRSELSSAMLQIRDPKMAREVTESLNALRSDRRS